jgi:ElaB/YqjD/DUF883 family membrane-anchored ribosome-binding protein
LIKRRITMKVVKMPVLRKLKAERIGHRTAEAIGSVANVAGNKLDAAIDFVSDKTQRAEESIRKVNREGWDGIKHRTSDYARKQPLTSLLLAIGTGLLVGLVIGRGRA